LVHWDSIHFIFHHLSRCVSLGVDRETVYTRKDAGTADLVGDSEIRPQILMPKDLCVALSEETDGSVFNTLQYTDTRPYIQKRFMDVLVRVIADKAEPSDCQICDCRPDEVGAGKADCRHCVRPNPIYDVSTYRHKYWMIPTYHPFVIHFVYKHILSFTELLVI